MNSFAKDRIFTVDRKMLFLSIGLLVATILFFFDPEKTVWLPKCPFYLLTGCKCPACGTQRAVYQLLHGNVSAALHYNAFLVISVPYASVLVASSWLDTKNKLSRLRHFCQHHITVYVYLTATIAWWICRNLVAGL